MLILQGADISRLSREVRRGLGIVERVYTENCEVTILTKTFKRIDEVRSSDYGHDVFTVRLPVKFPDKIIGMVRYALGHEYNVVEEQDHVHVEYDPKRSYK